MLAKNEMMDMAEHPQRQALIDELHARPFFDFKERGGSSVSSIWLAALITLLFSILINGWKASSVWRLTQEKNSGARILAALFFA